MYAAYFGLRDLPFSITPDPGYLYMSPYHQEALAHLLYGIQESGGFVQITGEVGTGKTTLIRTLVEQRLENVELALCLNPRLTVEEFVASVCDELKIDYPKEARTLKPLIDALNEHLLSAHRRGLHTVLIIDEAQNLSLEVLEQVRLLTNLETRRDKLLRIILVGQPELQLILEREDMRQLNQRITARYYLTSLGRKETAAYVIHRLRIAGGRDDLFTPAALRAVYRFSHGIPRVINVICDRALLGAYVGNKQKVDKATVRRAAYETLQGRTPGWVGRFGPWLAGLAVVGSVAAVLSSVYWLRLNASSSPPALLAQTENPSDSVIAPAPPTASPAVPATADVPAAVPSAVPKPLPASSAPVKPASAPVPSSGPEFPPEAAAEPEPEPEPGPEPGPVSETPPDLERLVFAGVGALDPSLNPMQRLLHAWGVELDVAPGAYPCEQLQEYALRCFSGQGDWHELRRFNRPAILSLRDASGEVQQILLRALDQTHATLDLAGQRVRVELAQIDRLWVGDFLLLWRLQTTETLIGPGSQGAAVIWLRQRLALAAGESLVSQQVSPVFDTALQEQVKAFQRLHGLQPDGLVGARTMMSLNEVAPTPGTPLLSSAGEDR